MPRIPLYNQGQGSAVRLQAGQLSRRADVGAFTAPGRAAASFASSASDIASTLALQERNREDRTILNQEKRAAAEFFHDKRIQDQSTKIGDAEAAFDGHRSDYMRQLESKGYSKRRQALITDAVEGIYLDNSLGARRSAFDRGTKLATDEDNAALDLNLNQMKTSIPGMPQYDLAQKNVNDIITNANSENRKLKYTPETFAGSLAIETYNTKLEAATTPAQIDSAYQALLQEENISSAKKLEAKSARNTAKTRLGNELYGSALETIIEGDYDSQELQEISQGYEKGEDFTLTRDNGEEVSFSVSDMPIAKRLTISEKSEKLRGDFNNEVRAGIVSDITDAFEMAGSEGVVAVASEAVRTSEDKEQADEALLGAARNLEAQSKIAYSQGDFGAAAAFADAAESILTESFSNRPSLNENAGATGNSANTILKSLAKTRGDIQDDQQEAVKLADGVSLMEDGVYDNLGGVFLPSEERKILNMVMQGKSLPQQLEILEQNNLTFEPMRSTVNGAATEGLGATPDFREVSQGLELYRQMKIRGKGVLANNSDEASRAFFDSVLSLEEVGMETEDAINKVNRAFNSGIDRNAKFNTVKAEVDRILDPTVTTIFGWEVMGTTVNNRSYVTERVSNLAKIYIGLGKEPSDAVRLAGENVNASHMNLRGNYIPRSTSYPKDIETMADLVAMDYVSKNQNVEESEVSIIPVLGRADEYLVTVAGVPGQQLYSMEDLTGLKQKAQKEGTLEILSKAAEKKSRREAIISGESGTIQSRIRKAQQEQLEEIADVGGN